MGCKLELKYSIETLKSIDTIIECINKVLLQEDCLIDIHDSFEYEIFRLMSGTRIITVNRYDEDRLCFVVELTTDKNLNLYLFNNQEDMDLYILNN